VKHWLWRAVDQTGIVLDVLVQRRRDKGAAKRLLRKLLKKQMRPPRVMITDKLASYGAATRETMPGIEHRQHKGLNNRAENSHQATRRRERQMKQFKSAGQAQRFLAAHDQINNLFHLRRDHVTATCCGALRVTIVKFVTSTAPVRGLGDPERARGTAWRTGRHGDRAGSDLPGDRRSWTGHSRAPRGPRFEPQPATSPHPAPRRLPCRRLSGCGRSGIGTIRSASVSNRRSGSGNGRG
jgi:putative transposase